jgi:Site-specific DNA methylase
MNETKASKKRRIVAVDLFCGCGGLTRGLLDSGIKVVAGYDAEERCRYVYEKNNHPARFHRRDITTVTGNEIRAVMGDATVRVLAGCPPCQPYSILTPAHSPNKGDVSMIAEFFRIIKEADPDIVIMENVPQIQQEDAFIDFQNRVEGCGYFISTQVVNCGDYGIPQRRKRMIFRASKFAPIAPLEPVTPDTPLTVRDAIGDLPPIPAGSVHASDPMHRAGVLSPLNIKRLQASRPGGTWLDWPESLRLACHRRMSGFNFKSANGRMEWGKPSPTMTTQFTGLGCGRFGHPDQDRSITLREGARFQTFPDSYRFVENDSKISVVAVSRMIGNAVPPRLGNVIGKSVIAHTRKKRKSEVRK